jgi:putative sigma-54 modulation protein
MTSWGDFSLSIRIKSEVSAERHSMQVAITARHGSVKQDLTEYVTRKSQKLVRYLDQVSEIDVTFEFEAERVNVEMLVEIEGYHTIVAYVEGEDAGTAFDRTLQKMEHQVHRYKEKLKDHRRDKPVNEIVQTDAEEDLDAEEDPAGDEA